MSGEEHDAYVEQLESSLASEKEKVRVLTEALEACVWVIDTVLSKESTAAIAWHKALAKVREE